MRLLFAVGIGSFIGGSLRYLLSLLIASKKVSVFPTATLLVNVAGCLVIGMVIGLSDKGTLNDQWRLFLTTGILGGFTTFSAFSSEAVMLLKEGQIFYAAAYISASVLLGLLATYFGLIIIKSYFIP